MIDLHVHSTASDGSESPTAVVRMAAAAGLKAIALTDHDTQAGIAEARAEADRSGVMELIPGTELSLEWAQGAMHMVVLFLEPGPGPLQDRLAALREGRSERNARIVERLAGLGLPVSEAEILELAGGESVGRPHIAAVMVSPRLRRIDSDAFDRYLAWGKPAYMARLRLSPEEAIAWPSNRGRCRSWPIRTRSDSTPLKRSRQPSEGWSGPGWSASSATTRSTPPSSARVTRPLQSASVSRPSGGSDYHGTYKPEVELGVGPGQSGGRRRSVRCAASGLRPPSWTRAGSRTARG